MGGQANPGDGEEGQEVDLALIIPCFNEEKRILKTLKILIDYCSATDELHNLSIVLIPVNDGSTDSTANILEQSRGMSKGRVLIQPVSYAQNIGKGGAILRGASSVRARYYGFTDADLSYPPSLIPQALQKLQHSDAVLGQREFFLSYSWGRRVASHILRRIVQILTGVSVLDTQCGFKFFRHRVVEQIFPHITHTRFSFDIEFIMLLQQQGLTINPLPVQFAHHTGSTVTWREGLRYCIDAVAIFDRFKQRVSRSFFIALSVLATIITAIVFGWTLRDGYFFSDDFTWIWHGFKINGSLEHILTDRMSSFYSPVMNAFYTIAQPWLGMNPAPYFFIGMIIHILVSILFSLLTFLLTHSRICAIVTVGIVAIAGSAYEPLVWVGSNMHSIVTLFIVTAVLLYAVSIVKKQLWVLPLSFLAVIGAYGTKESAIILPVLLVGIAWCFRKTLSWSKGHIAYTALVSLITAGYAFQQYHWQQQSVWVQQRVWSPELIALLKMPLILVDMVVPLRPILSPATAPTIWVFSTLLLLYALYRFRRLSPVWYGFVWAGAGILPTIFFRGATWWELTASRYTYLPRLGMILSIVSIFTYLIHRNTRRSVIDGFAVGLLLSSVAQISFMLSVIHTEYEYVYQSGRSLAMAAQVLAQKRPPSVVVDWNRPFTGNNAHIVGALKIIANINEEQIIFLEKGMSPSENADQALLTWDAPSREYRVLTERGHQ